VAGDAPSLPAQKGVGGDDPARSSWAGERGGDRAQDGPVVIADCGPVDLSAEDAELVAEHDELEVTGPR
jgi:hypothetical protein